MAHNTELGSGTDRIGFSIPGRIGPDRAGSGALIRPAGSNRIGTGYQKHVLRRPDQAGSGRIGPDRAGSGQIKRSIKQVKL